jgi:riboflavin biosynthesis pyrimidine reductase
LWIFATVHAPQTHQQKLEDAGARIWRVAADAQGHVDLDAVLALLHAAGVRTLMVEGGARVISAFFAAQLADRVVVTIAPKLVAGLHAVQSDMVQNAQLVNVHYQQLGDDMVLEADVVWR